MNKFYALMEHFDEKFKINFGFKFMEGFKKIIYNNLLKNMRYQRKTNTNF